MQSIAERKGWRRFPSVFQAWSAVDTLPNEDPVVTLARHDLAWVGLELMRATTTLALTHSDGYCLFSDPNPLPTADHRHDWYDFWNRRLGAPLSPSRADSEAAALPPEGVKVCPQWAHQTPLAPENTRCIFREFEGGTVVYNPMDSEAVVVHFPTPRLSVATGMIKTDHYLGNCDGDIYLH